MEKQDNLLIIGRAELVEFPSLGLSKIPAKTDTGADSSSIWASKVTEKDNNLFVVFFGPSSEFYTGEVIRFRQSSYSLVRVENSFGQREIRYKIKLPVKVKGKLIRATFTLSDRKNKTYPILLGRRMLSGKFLVDVQSGSPLKKNERLKRRMLQNF